jgi:hypothetical protein
MTTARLAMLGPTYAASRIMSGRNGTTRTTSASRMSAASSQPLK